MKFKILCIFCLLALSKAELIPGTIPANSKIFSEEYGQTIAETARTFWSEQLPKWLSTGILNPGQLRDSISGNGSLINQICKNLSLPANCGPELVKDAASTILHRISFPQEISANCISDVVNGFLGDLMTQRTFAINQLDATGKPAPGILEGNLNWPGNFEECFNIDVLPTPSSVSRYKGKYCTASISLKFVQRFFQSTTTTVSVNLTSTPAAPHISYCNKIPYNSELTNPTIKWGICVPDTCSEMDVFTLLYSLTTTPGVQSPMCNVQCQERTPLPWTSEAIIMLVILSIFGLIVLFGTTYDYFVYQPNEAMYPEKAASSPKTQTQPHDKVHKPFIPQMTKQEYYNSIGWYSKVIHAFSLYTNGKKILDTSTKPGQINCIHALRFISMSWVIMGHTFELLLIVDNPKVALKLRNNFLDQIVMNATYSVDTFFLLSGLLLSYLWFKEMKRCHGKKIKSAYTWIMFYVHRYLRLTPVYAILLGAEIVLARYLMRGPYGGQLGTPDYERCKKYWWTNLLYINNFVSSGYNEMCHSEFWYLANDMQFHILAPIFLLPLFYLWPVGIAVCAVVILASMGTIFGLVMYWHLPAPADFLAPPDPNLIDPTYYWKYMYIVPWTRINPYILGILLGWFMQKKPKLKIPKVLNLVIWLFVAGMCSAILFGLLTYQQGTYMPVGERAVYSAFCRTLWSLGVGWVILACYTGNGEPVNELLSWPGWIPVSRLTYCAYLTHVSLDYILLTSFDTVPHWSNHLNFLMTRYIPLLFLSYLVSFFASAVFEVPVTTLEKLIFAPYTTKARSPQQNTVTEQSEVSKNDNKLSFITRQTSAGAPHVEGEAMIGNGEIFAKGSVNGAFLVDENHVKHN